MSDDVLQLKKDAWWEVREAGQRVACLKRKITLMLRSAARAASGWSNEGRLFVKDGRIIANHADGSLSSDIKFGNSRELHDALLALEQANEDLAAAQSAFDRLL